MHASFFTARLVALAVIASVVSAKDALPADCDRTATVKAGETCSDICAKYGVPTYQLAAVNKGVIDPTCTNLVVDQVLCLGIKGHDCKATHVVKKGETCHSIADANDIEFDTFILNNLREGFNCTYMRPAEVLCIETEVIRRK
ncbi:uncharacterized protein EDB93DRAFT_1172793 [Suillus bovinus]|uniref:uncharacterized protein n=1 Tax=Suillus bovinus TaxID=48563 RepID=UPI001B862B33|nr:uncharacterized protein EDB93DRAFT_1172793 [Suillus bovinus]KAG2134152.1 hypothetical protein EDB93DRAFT_1172793 [Suillus bovinus]